MKCLVINFSIFLNGKLYPIGSTIDYPDNLPLPENLQPVLDEEIVAFRKRGRPRKDRPAPGSYEESILINNP